MDKAIDPQIWLAQAKLESVATRYPNMLQDSIDEYKTTQALNHAEEILHWAAKAIKHD